MKSLIVHSHPQIGTYGASLKDAAAEALRNAGHEVHVRDLYADAFDPVLPRQEWVHYREEYRVFSPKIQEYIEELRSAEIFVAVFPSWWYGMPAIMKGYLDRVWVPGVAFGFSGHDRLQTGYLDNIRRFTVITTYGSSWWIVGAYLGEPGRRIATRGFGRILHRRCKISWLAKYGMDQASTGQLADFRSKIVRELSSY